MIVAPDSAASRAALLLWVFVLTNAALATLSTPGLDRDTKNYTTTVPNPWTRTAPFDKNDPTKPSVFRVQKSDENTLVIKPALRKLDEFLNDVANQRKNTSTSIMTFDFIYNRVHVLSRIHQVPKSSKGIVYWMHRDQRLHDNWALLHAQKLAIRSTMPLHILIFKPQNELNNYLRHHAFIMEGLKKIEEECLKMNIQFHFIIGDAAKEIPIFVRKHKIGALVVDFSPLRDHVQVTRLLGLALLMEIPVIQVDAHNIVPCWFATDHQEQSLTQMRSILGKKFPEFFTEFPPLIKHPFSGVTIAKPTNWSLVDKMIEIDPSVKPLQHLKSGYEVGMHYLNIFLKHGLERYCFDRNNPLRNGISFLSPFLNKGHISAQRVLLEILKFQNSFPTSVTYFKEDLLVRREIADNFCYYNSKYDSYEGGSFWGLITLNRHRNDTRRYVYTRDEFEGALTHDDLWNACQIQMMGKGKTHRYLRSYWAKKILEFSKTPESAIAIGNYLNNKYSIDGNDPNGFVGILYAMTGLHDLSFTERPIFGKIRFISSAAFRKKFNAAGYIKKYGAVSHPYTKK